MAPIVHLVCGPVGAGKTTYSRKLASERHAVVFSIDEWMQNLFVADLSPQTEMAKIDFAWFSERVDRCETQIWSVALQLLNRGESVILDLGFLRKARRDKARIVASGQGFESELHIISAEVETRRRRVSARNLDQGRDNAFAVTPAMFDFAEKMYEAPDQEEAAKAITSHT